MKYKIFQNFLFLFFKYDQDIINKLKSLSFRWYPDDRCWGKKINLLNDNDLNFVKEYINDYDNFLKEYQNSIKEYQNSIKEKEKEKEKFFIYFEEKYPYYDKLYEFQKEGVFFLSQNNNSLLCDEMGLGKTIQVLSYISLFSFFPALVICPANLKLNWKKEIEKWTKQDIKIQVIKGIKDNVYKNQDVYIINYDIIQYYIEPLNLLNLKIIILDEFHYIKNFQAKRTKSILKLKSERKVALSGTPLLNRPVELFPCLNYLFPSDFSKFWWYAQRYCNAYKDKWGWHFDGASNLNELKNKLKDKMLRRLKSEVLDLPEKIRTVIPLQIEFDKETIELETKIKIRIEEIEEITKRIEEAKKNGNEAELEILKIKKKEAVNYAFAEIEEYRQRVARLKLPSIIEFMNSMLEQNGKIVVFCHHRNIYNELMKNYGNIAVGVQGGDSIEKRNEAVNKFQNNDDVKIFVGSIRASGEGITLTSASKVIFAEYDWTPSRMKQAEDRLHRIGQKCTVNSYWFSAEGSIDDYFLKKIIEKIDIIKSVVSDEDNEIYNII